MLKSFKNALELVGNTPIVKIQGTYNGYKPQNLWAKLESYNPTGSVKDRAALYMIKKGIDNREICPDTVIVEPTSGNTGVSLAYIANFYKFKFIATMPESMSIERRNLIKAYGADVVLTPREQGMKGAIDKANKIIAELKAQGKDVFQPKQFENEANILAHYETTAVEILEQTDNKVGAIVAGVGSSGTLCGSAKKLKEVNPNIKAYGVESACSPMLSKGYACAHKIQGIGPNFVPKLYDCNLVDKILPVDDDMAIKTVKQCVKEDGLLIGISSGAVLSAALELDKKASFSRKNDMVVCILADSADRYFSEGLFDE